MAETNERKAEELWDAYRTGAGGKAHDGTPLVDFKDLDARAQDGWRAVASVVLGTTGEASRS